MAEKGAGMRTNNAWTRIIGTILMTVFLSASAAAVYAAGEPGSQEVQKVIRIPRTAEEHRAMAESYRLKAIAYEQEAQTHRLICEEYKFKGFMPMQPMSGHSMKQVQERCERYVRDATDLAENARELAEYHAEQAKRLSGR